MHIAAELAPRAKVGGLGDVVAGLSLACAARGHAVSVMLPWYECVPEESVVGLTLADEFECPKGTRGGSTLRVRVYAGELDGVPVLLIRPDWTSSNLFRGDRIYGGAYNEAEAYLFFCRACLEHLQRAVVAGARDAPTAIHVHDWQACPAAMIYWPLFSKGALAGARLVLTVHNFDSMGEVKMDEVGDRERWWRWRGRRRGAAGAAAAAAGRPGGGRAARGARDGRRGLFSLARGRRLGLGHGLRVA